MNFSCMILSEIFKRLFIQSFQVLTNGVLQYCLRDLLGPTQRQTLFMLCNVLRQMTRKTIDPSKIEDMEANIHQCLALMERDFPVSLQVM